MGQNRTEKIPATNTQENANSWNDGRFESQFLLECQDPTIRVSDDFLTSLDPEHCADPEFANYFTLATSLEEV